MPWGDEALRSREAIQQLFQGGAAFHGKYLLLIVRHVDMGPRRVLFVASRRVGNAVHRNRAKRLMREAYRGLVSLLAADTLHFAWVARAACAQMQMGDVRADMVDLLGRAALVRRSAETLTDDSRPAQ